jgi:hypothetical protein
MGRKRVAGVDPVGVIQRESTGGDYAMDMGMTLEPPAIGTTDSDIREISRCRRRRYARMEILQH